MEPITQALLLSICGNFATDAIRTSYVALKKALTTKYGEDSDLIVAVNKLEQAPDRDDRKKTLEVEVELAKANNDSELLQLAHKLLDKVNQPSGQVSITVKDTQFACVSGTGDSKINIKY
ncbi:MAG: hypothetical protein QNJ51_30720 [Calothrix sp. MO_167.B12]|nr:hypothetical protein [Calothrix sp. MO_167.B12]